MKKIGTLKPGTIFTYAKEKFVVLEQMGDGVFCLQAQSHKSVPFAKGESEAPNNYVESFLRAEIEEVWLLELMENGAKPEDLEVFDVDLRETDGSSGYGTMTALAAPLTLWQYGKYKDIIPFNEEDWWWLVTPWRTRWLRSPLTSSTSNVWYVFSDGYCSAYDAYGSFGVRPALKLNSNLSVSVEGEEDRDCENGTVNALAGFSTLALIDELRRRYTEATVACDSVQEERNEQGS